MLYMDVRNWRDLDEDDVMRYVPLCMSLAKKYYRLNKKTRMLDINDMFSSGITTLCERIKELDTGRSSGPTFAYMVIKQGMMKYINTLKTGGPGRSVMGKFSEITDDNFFHSFSSVEQDHSHLHIDDIENKLKDIENFGMFKKFVNGETAESLSKQYGITRQGICHRIMTFKKRAKRRLRTIGITTGGWHRKNNNNRRMGWD